MRPQILAATKTDVELAKEHENYKVEFIIEGIIKKGGKNILAAERGTGKTRISLFMAYAMIYEYPEVFGYKISLFGDVLFINLEILERDFKAFTEPIRRYFERLGYKRKHILHITSFRERKIELGDIKLVVQKFSPLLTIIDSYKIYQALVCKEEGLREINNSNFDKVMRLMDELISEFDTTIALINHTNKGTSQMRSNSDLMFGPGALPDLVDHTTLLRKTKFDNKRIIIPDKSRYCGEGHITTNLIEIISSDLSSTCPDELYFELIEEDIDETDFLASRQNKNKRIDEETRAQIIEYVNAGNTYEKTAEKFLGNKNVRDTICRIMSKHKNDNGL